MHKMIEELEDCPIIAAVKDVKVWRRVWNQRAVWCLSCMGTSVP